MIQIYDSLNFTFQYCQENEQYNNRKGIIRGLHYQVEPYSQAKYCHVVKGKVLSVAVDIREKSKNFGKYISYELNDTNKKYMFIPKGYAHGYITLSNESIFIYQVDEYFNLEAMRSISFDDKDLNIDRKIDIEKVILSDKDSIASQFRDVEVYKGDL